MQSIFLVVGLVSNMGRISPDPNGGVAMPAEGRTFRRKVKWFWEIWPMPPRIESERDVVFVDGISMCSVK